MDADASRELKEADVTIIRRLAGSHPALAEIVGEYPDVLAPVRIESVSEPRETNALVAQNVAMGASRPDERVVVTVYFRLQ